jgi:hypothetical protein
LIGGKKNGEVLPKKFGKRRNTRNVDRKGGGGNEVKDAKHTPPISG